MIDRHSAFATRGTIVTLCVLAFVFALRMAHLSSALQSPLSYQPGPDEDYYLRFGQAVAANHGASSAEFTFMDPAYGYLLGAIFKLIGANVFAVYLLQALLDTATAYAILLLGCMLGRPRAGTLGALLYGVTSTALLFCAALLKETCVAAFLTWWVVAALALQRSERKLAWFGFGVFCATGAALRSTLIVLGPLALLLPFLYGRSAASGVRAALLVCGMVLALLPWSLRNEAASGSLSPLPHNGGIVLHQAYNAANPGSTLWIPAFVNYSHPSEIWRGYAGEAETRTGEVLSAAGINRYWRDQAFVFIRSHPAQVMGDMVRKASMYLSATEVPNNRSAQEERLFSPIMALLPPPTAWLLAMGLSGLIWWSTQDRRLLLVAVPIALAWATFAIFWAEDRFRLHSMPMLALCSGFWLDRVASPSEVKRRTAALAVAAAALICTLSFYLGTRYPPPPISWEHVVWGYIKMGKLQSAKMLTDRTLAGQPDNAPLWEAAGYLAATSQHYAESVGDYQRAIALRPRSYLAHFNLAKAYLEVGDPAHAAAEAKIAFDLSASPDARALLDQIAAAPAAR